MMNDGNHSLDSQQLQREHDQYVQISSCKNLKELMDKYGIRAELDKGYYEGIQFVPDKAKFIRNRIELLEKNVREIKIGVGISDTQIIQLGQYVGIGFDWVNNGHNAAQNDLDGITRRNVSIQTEVPAERREWIYYAVLAAIAKGAATAFHLAFLQEQLTLVSQDKALTEVAYFQRKPLPVFTLKDLDRLWLQTLYDISLTNKRPNLREMKSQLKGQMPRSYDPAMISSALTLSNGEEISPLGIRALEGNDSVLNKMNAILRGIQQLLEDDPDGKIVEVSDIARHAKLPLGETSFLFHLMTHYFRFSSSAGTRTQGYYGLDFFSIDDAAYKNIMRYEDFTDVVVESLKLSGQLPAAEDQMEEQRLTAESAKSATPGTTATQVLAMHFLLKQCGINPIDQPANVARFLQFLTGKETNAKKIQNTNLYKNISHPFKEHEKSLLKELKTIREYFEKMGLDAIVAMIDCEINTSNKSG
jgi:hypothetical protein